MYIYVYLYQCSVPILYTYNIPVWCTTVITPPREDCRPRATTQGFHICFIIPNNIQNTKGEK